MYLSLITDVYSKQVVGYELSDWITLRQLTVLLRLKKQLKTENTLRDPWLAGKK